MLEPNIPSTSEVIDVLQKGQSAIEGENLADTQEALKNTLTMLNQLYPATRFLEIKCELLAGKN